MRNFKKLTALVLVFVMALALVVPYASAVTYDDQEDINPDFAADLDLLYELQIIIGSDNLFRPKDTATRAELIKTAYVIEHGTYANPADADRYKTTNVPFTDYDSSKWYAGHVNWAYIEKIINGTSATTFEPERDITGFETLKVLLGVIGFIPEYEGYDQGSEWANRVLALADKTGLIEGIENVDFSRPITREVMAHAIYNTLFTNIVSYVKDTHEISNTTSKTVVEEYFGLQTLDDARVLANRYVGIDGKTKTGGNTIETDIYGKIAVSADVAADFELIGRSVTLYVKTEPQVAAPYFKITKLYGKPVLNNADELIQVTADDLTASGTVSIVVSGTTYTSASVAALSNNTLYINFLEDVDTNLNLVVGDNPVDLIVDGNTIKYVLAYDYTFVKLAVASGKVTATEFDTPANKTINALATSAIIKGSDLLEDEYALAAKIGGANTFVLEPVEVVIATVDRLSLAAGGTVTLDNGKSYTQGGFTGTPVSFAFATGAVGKEKTFLAYGDLLLGSVEEAPVVTPTTYAVVTAFESATISNVVANLYTDEKATLSKIVITSVNGSTASAAISGLLAVGDLYTYVLSEDGKSADLKTITDDAGDDITYIKGATTATVTSDGIPYVSTKSIFFVKWTNGWNVYKNRTLPNVTTATLVSYVKKNQTLAANDTITVATFNVATTDPGTGATSSSAIGLLVANTYFSVEGSTGYLYYTVQVGTEIKTYKEKAPDGTGLTADKNSIIKIDTVSETNALEIKTKTIYTPGTLAALSSPGSAKAYVAALDGLQIFLGQSNNAAGAWDATVTEFSLDGTKIYKVAADGTAVAATSADLTVTAVGSTTKGGFTVIAFLSTNSANPDKITHLFIVG